MRLEIGTMGRMRIIGPQKARGRVRISGAKNSALPIMAASILTDEDIILKNIPNLADVNTMIEILESAGKKVYREGDTIVIVQDTFLNSDIPYEPVRRMRASFNVLGPLTVRVGKARVALPGGCTIGVRPVNFHLEGLKKLGIISEVEHGYVNSKYTVAPEEITISLPYPSVGATEHIMTTASLLPGTITTISNAAQEPEIMDLANFLKSMGARIEGEGTSTIKIEGIAKLRGTEYKIIPDRIEAGTYAILSVMVGKEVIIENIIPKHILSLLYVFDKIGVVYQVDENELKIWGSNVKELQPVDIETSPFPGFPTDLQPQMMSLLSLIPGRSSITENVFKTRFNHVDELNRMGANIMVEGNTAIISGVKKLSGAPIEASDLRGTASLILAAFAAEGETVISNVDHIFRGYENLLDKFRDLNLEVEYIE